MADEFTPKHGQVVAIPFSASNLTTGAANQDFIMGGGTSMIVAPKSGSVVGISARVSAAITAGTITISPHKASTEFSDSGFPQPVLSSTAQTSYAIARPKVCTFSAGDTLGISCSTTTTLNATDTLDVDGVLWLMVED